MQKIKFGEKEFLTTGINENTNYLGVKTLTISLDKEVTFKDALTFFGGKSNETMLNHLETWEEKDIEQTVDNVISTTKEWQQQGMHVGYTKVKRVSINTESGCVEVDIEKALDIEIAVRQLQETNRELESAVAELAYGGVK